MGVERDSAKDYLYYATGWIWPEEYAGKIKSLLLFFDGVTLSLPEELLPGVIDRSPALAQPLFEKQMLINLPPEDSLTPASSSQLARALTQWIHDNPGDHGISFHERPLTITSAHWGERTDRQITNARRFTEKMQHMGLARATGELWELSPQVHLLVLMAYCHSLQESIAERSELTLQPVLDGQAARWPPQRLFEAITRCTNPRGLSRQRRSAVQVIESDWHEVGVDLTNVPLDEILDFRAEHREGFSSYTHGLRNLILSTGQLNDEQFAAELRVRAEQISEEAASLRKVTRRAFGQTAAATVLALCGATWTATQGDLIGALFATASAGVGFARPSRPVTAYSYFFDIDRRFG